MEENNIEKNQIKSFINNPLYSDIILEVDGREIHAHKVYLSQSKVFLTMFTSQMMEHESTKLSISYFIDYESFIDFLRFLYHDNFSFTDKNFVNMYKLADYYCVDKLIQKWFKNYKTYLCKENIFDMFRIAIDIDHTDLITQICMYFKSHYESISDDYWINQETDLIYKLIKNYKECYRYYDNINQIYEKCFRLYNEKVKLLEIQIAELENLNQTNDRNKKRKFDDT